MIAAEIETVTIEEAFEHLAKSIVIQAIEDYRECLKYGRIKLLSKNKYNIQEIEKFFKSDWFHILSGMNGERLIKILQEQAKNDAIN